MHVVVCAADTWCKPSQTLEQHYEGFHNTCFAPELIYAEIHMIYQSRHNTTVACLMEGFPFASMKQFFVMNFHKGVPIVFNINYHAEFPKKRIILNLLYTFKVK